MRYLRTLSAPILIMLITGCAGYSPGKDIVGKKRSELLANMGQPDFERKLEGISALHFARGPTGSHTYIVYLDPNDVVMHWEQVLTEERFETIQAGMTKDEVVDRIGRTKITNMLARNRGYVWHYRYETPLCKSFVIEFTPEDTVRSAGYRVRSGRSCKYVGMG